MLTIVIPNYNRRDALDRLLTGVFEAIDFAMAHDIVKVQVVDDHSDDDLSAVVAKFSNFDNFEFRLQHTKCGNAERALLSSMVDVTTEFAWIVGNDDEIAKDALAYLLSVLQRFDPSFILLNPAIKLGDGRLSLPLRYSSEICLYDAASDLFRDLGFVTSTTTFTCFIVRTRLLAAFHEHYRLINAAEVYAHTFSFFGAFRNDRALLLGRPIVKFTQNCRKDEQKKLQSQSPAGIFYYPQSLGLCRLINACAAATAVTHSFFGSCLEDEIDKDRNVVQPITLAGFVAKFFVRQLAMELEKDDLADLGCLAFEEVREIAQTIERFDEPALTAKIASAVTIHQSVMLEASDKLPLLHAIYREIERLGKNSYVDQAYENSNPSGLLDRPHKIIPSTSESFPLLGKSAVP
jgi:hypothetical protein